MHLGPVDTPGPWLALPCPALPTGQRSGLAVPQPSAPSAEPEKDEEKHEVGEAV